MEIKLKQKNKDGHSSFITKASIREVMINEDFLHPEKETIAIAFSGSSSSGILEMTPNEIEKLYNTVKRKMHLIRGFKKFGNVKKEKFS